jgi:hypothetical protein
VSARSFARLGPLAALAIGLGGCVYYNGVYNARRLAGLAEKAERDGRTFDASGYWGQVSVKAESVIVRHPDSKWVEEALVLRGQALANLKECANAVTPLRRALAITADPDRIERAHLAYGMCQLQLGEPDGAVASLAGLTRSRVPARRAAALLLYVRALRLSGHAADAVPLVAAMGPSAAAERMVTLADAGQSAAAVAIADSFLARRDSVAPWDTLLAALGRHDPRAASSLLDRLDSVGPPARHARWLYDDAQRLAVVDPARADERLSAAAAVADAGDVRAEARLASIGLALRAAPDVAALAASADSLAALTADEGTSAGRVGQLQAAVVEIRAADSLPPLTPQADIRLFLAAEAARERLNNRALAATLLRHLLDRTPDSPYAPKALLALGAVDSAAADSARAVVEERYAGSPYAAAVRGEISDGYRVLEDSLGAFALEVASGPAEPDDRDIRRPRALPGRRVAPADSVSTERPIRRPAATGGRRVDEQP